MKRDKETYIKRLIVVMWCLCLAVIMALVWCTIQVQTVRHQFVAFTSQKPLVIRGIDGQNGLQGVPGLSMVGAAGQNATPQQIAQAVVDYMIANPVLGVKGDKGDQGTPGRTLETRIVPDTCVLQSKYTDETFWNNVAQLPTPCTKDSTEAK